MAARDFWFIKNLTQRQITISDLNKLPTIGPEKSFDALTKHSKEEVVQSANLKSLIRQEWVKVVKVEDGTHTNITADNLDEFTLGGGGGAVEGLTNPLDDDLDGDGHDIRGIDTLTVRTIHAGGYDSPETLLMEGTINFSGAIGIGTITPSYGIDIKDNGFRVRNPTTPSVTAFVVADGGNVGVGTNNPTATLTVQGFHGGQLGYNAGDDENYESCLIQCADGTETNFDSTLFLMSPEEGITLTHNSAAINLHTESGINISASGAFDIFVTTDGNVGIGTDTPETRFHVASSHAGWIKFNVVENEQDGFDVKCVDTSSDEFPTIQLFMDPEEGFYVTQSDVAFSVSAGQAVMCPQTSAPASTAEGGVYYNMTSHKLFCFNGTIWKEIAFV